MGKKKLKSKSGHIRKGGRPDIIPHGLEVLKNVNHFFIQTTKEVDKDLSEIKFVRMFQIFDVDGKRIFRAGELSNSCCRCCFGGGRPFEIYIINDKGDVVMQAKRPCGCLQCICWCAGNCAGNRVEVYTEKYQYFGKVSQQFDCCFPNYQMIDTKGGEKLAIVGPSCGNCNCKSPLCCDTTFKLYEPGGKKIGNVRTSWHEHIKDFFTEDNIFGISFPRRTKGSHKTLILGAIFFIGLQYFESDMNPPKEGQGCRKGPGCYGWGCIVIIFIFGGLLVILLWATGSVQL